MSQDPESQEPRVNSNSESSLTRKLNKSQDEFIEEESKNAKNSQRVKLKLPEILSNDDRHESSRTDNTSQDKLVELLVSPKFGKKDIKKSDKARFDSPLKLSDESSASNYSDSAVSFEETQSKKHLQDDESSATLSSRSEKDFISDVASSSSNSSTPREKFASFRKKVFSSSKTNNLSPSPPFHNRESLSLKFKKPGSSSNEYRVSGSLTQRPTTNDSSDDLSDDGEFTLAEFLAQEKRPSTSKKKIQTNLRSSGTPLKVKRSDIVSYHSDTASNSKNDNIRSFNTLSQPNLIFSFSSPCLPTELSEDDDEEDSESDEAFDVAQSSRFRSSPEIPFVRKASLKRKLRSSNKNMDHSRSSEQIPTPSLLSTSPRSASAPLNILIAEIPLKSPIHQNIVESQNRRASSPAHPATPIKNKTKIERQTTETTGTPNSAPLPLISTQDSQINNNSISLTNSPLNTSIPNTSLTPSTPPSSSAPISTSPNSSKKSRRREEEFKKWNSASDVLKNSDIKISDKERAINYSLDGSQEDVTIPYYTKIFSQTSMISLMDLEKSSKFGLTTNLVHHIYIGNDKTLGPYIVSILDKGEESTSTQISQNQSESLVSYTVLICSKKGNDLQKYTTKKSKKKPSMDTVLKSIAPSLGRNNLKRIKDSSIINKIVNFEAIQIVNNFKFGILYCKEGQVHEREMFANEHGSLEFKNFLYLLGKKIKLKSWPRYSGGLDTSENCLTGKNALYTEFRDLSLIFHVSTMLPFYLDDPQQLARKRHLGNDIVLLVFKEGNTPYYPDTVASTFNRMWNN